MQAQACTASKQPDSPLRVPDVRLFVGGYCQTVRGERFCLGGDREYSAAHRECGFIPDGEIVNGFLDSGAFTDRPERRLAPAQALDRQLAWEARAARRWERPGWQVSHLVSYDRLIDETWLADGTRHKRRWTVQAAESAVSETVDATAYLASQRERLAPRTLVLSCQGVDAAQYTAAARAVLAHMTPDDWFGFGGWCILGRWTSWLPTFWATLYGVLPEVAARGVRHVHIFGVLYRPALGGLLWLADQHGLTVSTDSSTPVLSATYKTEAARKKAGCRGHDWRENVRYWQHQLATLRASVYYHKPPQIPAVRQLTLMSA